MLFGTKFRSSVFRIPSPKGNQKGCYNRLLLIDSSSEPEEKLGRVQLETGPPFWASIGQDVSHGFERLAAPEVSARLRRSRRRAPARSRRQQRAVGARFFFFPPPSLPLSCFGVGFLRPPKASFPFWGTKERHAHMRFGPTTSIHQPLVSHQLKYLNLFCRHH